MENRPPADAQFRAEEEALGALIDRIRAHAVAKGDLPWPSENTGRMYQVALIRAQRELGNAIQYCGFALVDLAPDAEVIGDRR